MNTIDAAETIATRRAILRIVAAEDSLAAQLVGVASSWLNARLEAMLDGLDEQLFLAALNTDNTTQQNTFFSAMRKFRETREALTAAFGTEFRESFGNLIATACTTRKPGRALLESSRRQIRGRAIREISARTAELHRPALRGVNSLLNGFVGRSCFDTDSLELIPTVLCSGAVAASEALGLDAATMPMLFGAFEKQVMGELDSLCVACGGVLLDAGVAPRSQRQSTTVPRDTGSRNDGFRSAEEQKRNAADYPRQAGAILRHVAAYALLPVPIGKQISRLQPYLAKAAVADPDILFDSGHPFARLIEEIAESAIGWSVRQAQSAALLDAVVAIIEELLQPELPIPGRNELEDLLEQWRCFARAENREIRLNQRRTEKAEEGKARLRAAEASARMCIDSCVRSQPMPGEAVELLQEGWLRVLACAGLSGGECDSERAAAVHVLEEFTQLWARPTYSMPETLVQRMRRAMIGAGCNPLRVDVLLCGVDSAFDAWEPVPRGADTTRGNSADQVDQSADPGGDRGAALDALPQLEPGDWVILDSPPSTAVYARFACRVAGARSMLFVDREGFRLAQFDVEDLAARLESGDVRAVRREPLLANAREAARLCPPACKSQAA